MEPRSRPMRVIGLGAARTGNQSIETALKNLGYRPYESIYWLTEEALPEWNAMMDALVHDKPSVVTRERLDRLTGDFDAILDAPAHLFPEDMLRVYPDAKFILQERDFEGWYRSMSETFLKVARLPGTQIFKYIDPWSLGGFTYDFVKLSADLLCDGELDNKEKIRSFYIEHYERVKRVIPADRLLVYSVRQGYEPLCKFLEKPIPKVPFPWVNTPEKFQDDAEGFFQKVVLRIVRNLGVCLLSAGALLATVRFFWRQRRLGAQNLSPLVPILEILQGYAALRTFQQQSGARQALSSAMQFVRPKSFLY